MTPTNTLAEALQGAFFGDFTQQVIDGLYAKFEAKGLPTKTGLTAEEAAWTLGLTKRAFLQATWLHEIPVFKLGIQNRWRPKDIETFAANHLMKIRRR